MDMILSECLNAANDEVTRHGGLAPAQWYYHVFHAVPPPWVTKMNVLMWVLYKHMLLDRLTSVYSPRYRGNVKHWTVRWMGPIGWLRKFRDNYWLFTEEHLRTDSPAGDVDSHNIVCSWCAQAHVSIHARDVTNGNFIKDKLLSN